MTTDDYFLEHSWSKVQGFIQKEFGQTPDLNSILFLIGVQELGKGKKSYDKEEKQDLMHLGVCKVLSLSGFYELEGKDAEGWPHWQPTKKLPFFSLEEQEKVLKMHIIEYFRQEVGLKI